MTATQRVPQLHGKRDRPASSNNLLSLDGPAAKQQEIPEASPLLEPLFGEPKASYFARLATHIDPALFSAAHAFDRDGIFLYKRPVRSASNQATLLAQGGTVFHHCVVYVKEGDELVSLEFGPANAMDITANFLEEAPAAPVLSRAPAAPEPECLPMLHIAAEHQSLDAEHVQKALRFAERQPYQALRNNCIAFADFCVRVLTGGAVRSAPLIFDAVVGKVPPQDSPLLGFLYMTTQLTWFNVCDGSRLVEAFLREQHLGAARPALAATRVSGVAAGARVARGAVHVQQDGQQQHQQQRALQAAVAAAAAAAAAEAEEAAATAVAEASQQAVPAVANATVPAAASTAGRVAALPPQAAAPGVPGRQPSPAVPADSARSEGTAVGGLSRLASVQSSLSRMHSSGSSRSLGSVAAAAAGRFDPLGVAAARRKVKQSGSS
ncbi:hypothetical protein N2152v2_005494 [Parachlorella kessleri]